MSKFIFYFIIIKNHEFQKSLRANLLAFSFSFTIVCNKLNVEDFLLCSWLFKLVESGLVFIVEITVAECVC